MTFNEKIDAFMQKNGIPNLKQFSLLAGIPYTTLRDFYDKQSADNSRLSTIRKLSNYMNCSMDYLAYDDVTETNEIELDGLDIDEDSDCNNDKEFVTKITLNNEEDKSSVINYLEKNDFQYRILPNVSKQPNDPQPEHYRRLLQGEEAGGDLWTWSAAEGSGDVWSEAWAYFSSYADWRGTEEWTGSPWREESPGG